MQIRSSHSLPVDNIKGFLTELMINKLKINEQDLKANKSFDTYGMDSLKTAEILKGIEAQFGLQLSFSTLEQNDNLEDLAQSIAQSIAQREEKTQPTQWQKVVNQLGLVGGQLLQLAYNSSPQIFKLAPTPVTARAKTGYPEIVSSCSAFPETYYPQEQLIDIFHQSLLQKGINLDFEQIVSFFTNVTIQGRYLALSPENILGNQDTLKAGIDRAEDLAQRAIKGLLQQSALLPQDIAMVVEVSLLPATPSIFARLLKHIPFPAHTKRMSLYGVGCMCGVHGLGKVHDYLKGHPDEAVILVSVEIASVLWQGSFQKDLGHYLEEFDSNPSEYEQLIKMTLVTAALFADGAMALLIVGPEHPYAKTQSQPRLIDSHSNIVPDTVDLIGVDILIPHSSIRAVVKPEVPELLPAAIEQTIAPLLARHHLRKEDIAHWILHPGGPKIVRAIEERFALNSSAFQLSWDTLSQVGNLSSAHALYILHQLLSSPNPPERDTYGVVIAMGPGLSQEAMLVKF